ncbi:hypothetical protein D3C85_1510840 [compost metagenome]
MPLQQRAGDLLADQGVGRLEIGLELAGVEQCSGSQCRVLARGQGQVVIQVTQAALVGAQAEQQLVVSLVHAQVLRIAL